MLVQAKQGRRRHGPIVYSSAVGALDSQDERVVKLHQAAAALHQVPLSLSTFAEAHAAAIAAGAPPDAIAAADLYLALACLAGSREALAIFERDVLAAVLPSVVRACRDSMIAVDDVIQRTRERLFVEQPPKLAQYLGRGPLIGWVRIVAVREALQDRRKSRRQRARDDAALLGAPDAAPDLEVDVLQRRYGAAFRLAVTAALRRLTAEQRTLLRLHTHDGLSIDQLAPILGVHRATAARRLERARTDALEQTRAILRENHGLSPSEARSLVAVLGRALDISIGAALASEGTS